MSSKELCNHMNKNKVLAVVVYLERRRSRLLVGELTYDAKKENYRFQYDKKYLQSKLIPLGPELPLSRHPFFSKTLFESFIDRLPSRENPAYKDYCLAAGIDLNEEDPLILLTSIGKRGPSSFIFEARYGVTFISEELRAFRAELHLTTKEFALGFSISEKTLISIEADRAVGRDVMKRLELYVRFPVVALFEFRRNCAQIHIEKRRFVEKTLTQKIKKS
jgi:HipA-like protein